MENLAMRNCVWYTCTQMYVCVCVCVYVNILSQKGQRLVLTDTKERTKEKEEDYLLSFIVLKIPDITGVLADYMMVISTEAFLFIQPTVTEKNDPKLCKGIAFHFLWRLLLLFERKTDRRLILVLMLIFITNTALYISRIWTLRLDV